MGMFIAVRLQVKLLKCLVDNIVVDISFNQMGGLVTLNFLEEINSLIGSSNIFKRSIILVSKQRSSRVQQVLLGKHTDAAPPRTSTAAATTCGYHCLHPGQCCSCGVFSRKHMGQPPQ